MDSTHRKRERKSTQTPPVAASLPEDKRNTAPETRARYRYQDECAAIALLNHLDSEDLEGVLIEHSTDLILMPVQSAPELVSIKHREPNQSGESGWSWSALKRQNVLIDLYRAWNSAERRCTLAFWTNGSFNGATHRLWKVCAGQAEPTPDLLRSLTSQLAAPRGDVEAFLAALTIPADPLPRRKEVTDVGIRRTAGLLEKYRPGAALYAETCYRALLDRIAKAGTDVPETEALPSPTVAATLAAGADRSQVRLMRRYLDVKQIFQELLSINDRQAASSLPDAGQHGWEPDAQFVGRSDILSDLDRLLRPSLPTKVSPVVIHGIPGCGKTSVAAQFAATHKGVFRPIFISASSRVALINELAILAGHDELSNWDNGIAQLGGPVTPRLPGNSATLLIIDGVTDTEAVHGIVPRKSLCRVIITSTVSYLGQGYEHIELNGWSRAESREFISMTLSEATQDDREKLAHALSDNPLALTQAVNYCKVTRHGIPRYLARLAREPLMMLDRGQASGHIASVTKAIKINIDTANERFPRSTEMLYLFSYLASSPIDESLFENPLVLTYAAEPIVRISPVKHPWWSITKRRKQQENRTVAYTYTQRGQDVFQSLCDHDWRDRAIEALLLTSLISRREEGLVAHPLVALVARNLAGDSRPWVEVGIGLFSQFMESAAKEDFTNLDPYIDHIAALASAALDADLSGPAVLVVCQILSNRLSVLGTNHRYNDRTSVQFGQRAVEIAEKSINSPWGSAQTLAAMRHALVIALWESGRVDDAIMYLRQNLELAHEYSDESILIKAVLDLGLVVAEISERNLAEEVLSQLNAELGDKVYGPLMYLVAGHVRTRLLRRLGRINEAKIVNEDALSRASEMVNCPDRALQDLHGDAGLLARDLGDSSAAFRHEMAALEIVRRNLRDRADVQDVRVLGSAADAAIEAGNLIEAETLISEAENVARAEFGIDRLVYAQILATRGRLRFVQRKYKEAIGDLDRATATLRNGSMIDRIKLPSALVHLAQSAQFLGDREKAWLSIKEAYDIDLSLYGSDHPETRKDYEIMLSMKLWDELDKAGIIKGSK